MQVEIDTVGQHSTSTECNSISLFLRFFTIQVSSVTLVKAERMECVAEIRPGRTRANRVKCAANELTTEHSDSLGKHERRNIKSHFLIRLSYFRLVGSLLLSILSSRHDNDWLPLITLILIMLSVFNAFAMH